MEAVKIESRQNPRILRLVALREQRKAREEEGLFIIEGMHELECAVKASVQAREVYFSRPIKTDVAEKLLEKLSSLPSIAVFELSEGAMAKASYRERPEGIIVVAQMRKHTLSDLPTPKGTPLSLVAEAIEKPGNMGALLRTADSAGCDGLICCDTVSDVYNPNVIRASRGMIFSVPFALATREETASWLHERGIKIFATSPNAKSLYWDCDFRSPSAIILGSEAHGLSPFWLEGGNATPIAIPQCGQADSLNVSVAAAVCLFEAVRQRART